MPIAAESDDLLRQIYGVRERRKRALEQDLLRINGDYDAELERLDRGASPPLSVWLLVVVGVLTLVRFLG